MHRKINLPLQKYLKRNHKYHVLMSATFLIIILIFLTFITPFVARFIQIEYLYRNLNFSDIMCQVNSSIVQFPTECCKMRVKRELYNYRYYDLPLLIHSDEENLPDAFDAREKWPLCESINAIRDQGACGSCWAVAVASTISDRLCIHSEGKIDIYISEEDLLTCCTECGAGCDGGDPAEAWKYWKKNGIVSGGAYGSAQGCKPYSFQPCVHTTRNCSLYTRTPNCDLKCRFKHSKNYWNDLHYGYLVYSIISEEQQIMKEIMENGPVQTRITLYEDFLIYKSGIYSPIEGSRKVSEHSVKVIGWGRDPLTGINYWIAANSFNTNWGEKGFFRIKRGNTCSFQLNVFGGIPKLD